MPTTTRKKTTSRVLQTDEEVLDDAARLQQETLSALRRIRTNVDETEQVGTSTVAALSDQSDKLKQIHHHQDRVDAGLRNAEKLQNRLGRLALRFNKRAAKKEVKKEMEEEQATFTTESSGGSHNAPVVVTPPTTPPVVVEKKKKQSRLLRKPASSSAPSWQTKPTRSRLLDKEPTGPHKEKLEDLQAVDDEIEDALDEVGSSLDRLMELNSVMSNEVGRQNKSLSSVSDRMAAADQKQRVINKRTTKFLDGKLRKQHERVDALPGLERATQAASMASRAMI